MQAIHLSQKELAERWRSDRIGPVFLKIMGRVFYRRSPELAITRSSIGPQNSQPLWHRDLALGPGGVSAPRLGRLQSPTSFQAQPNMKIIHF